VKRHRRADCHCVELRRNILTSRTDPNRTQAISGKKIPRAYGSFDLLMRAPSLVAPVPDSPMILKNSDVRVPSRGRPPRCTAPPRTVQTQTAATPRGKIADSDRRPGCRPDASSSLPGWNLSGSSSRRLGFLAVLERDSDSPAMLLRGNVPHPQDMMWAPAHPTMPYELVVTS